jgi:hypothetical protein
VDYRFEKLKGATLMVLGGDPTIKDNLKKE